MSVQGSGETYLTAPQLRARFGGRSDVWLWRLLKDERANFPKPIMVRRYRYFRLSEVEAWEEANRAKPIKLRVRVAPPPASKREMRMNQTSLSQSSQHRKDF